MAPSLLMGPAMTKLSSCANCNGFVPAKASACPHCDAAVPSKWPAFAKRVLGLSAGGMLSMTLMACYGLPPCDPDDANDPYCAPAYCTDGEDLDQDGICTPDDCMDMDPMIYPGAYDPDGDAVDQNCDGVDGVKSES